MVEILKVAKNLITKYIRKDVVTDQYRVKKNILANLYII